MNSNSIKRPVPSNKTFVVFILSFFIAFFASALPFAAAADSSDEVTLRILHTNDTHAHVASHVVVSGDKTEEVGGISRLVSYVKEIRAKEKNVLLLAAGDVFQGTLFFNFFKGLADFECMNMAGYDAMCFGNHEFDEGPEWLLKALQNIKFSPVNCNVILGKTYKDMPSNIKPYIIKEIGGIKVAIIGVITKDLFTLVSVKKLADVQVIDPVEALLPIVRELKPQVDMILLLSHMGLKEDLEISELVPDIDIVIGGHSHSLLVSPVVLRTSRGKQVVIDQAYEKGEYIGDVTMVYSKSKKEWRLSAGQIKRLDSTVPKDEEVQKKIDEYRKKIDAEAKAVIGEAKSFLDGGKDSVRAGETNLGCLIADILQNYTKADMAIINGGGIRASINKGPITIESCINVFPFSNSIMKLTLKGSIIRSAFEYVAKKRIKGNYGGFLHVSKGMSVTYRDGKVIELNLNGKPINDNVLYTLAMSDFTAGGGDGFNMFSTVPDRFTDGAKIADVLIEYVKNTKVIDAKAEGRIK